MPADKKKLIEEKNIHLWFRGSPLMFCSMKLELNVTRGCMFAYAKFMNVQPQPIKTVTCDIVCYDSLRHEVDVVKDCGYHQLDIERNKTFGGEIAFRINHPATRNVEFIITSVVTMNDEAWYNEDHQRFNIKVEQSSIFNSLKSLHRQFREDCAIAGLDESRMIFAPIFDQDYWMCACGTLNWNDEQKCSVCGAEKAWLRECVDPEVLTRQNQEREAAARRVRNEVRMRTNRSKKQQQEEFDVRSENYKKQRQRKERKNQKKHIIVVLTILAVLAVFGAAFVKFGLPRVKYVVAEANIRKGDYEDAVRILSSLDGYADSAMKLKEAIYGQATQCLNSGKLLEAAELYERIAEYRDAGEQFRSVIIELAKEEVKAGNLFEAADYYKKLGEASEGDLNSIKQKIYEQAISELKRKDYENAYAKFSYLEDYSNSENMAKECRYKNAKAEYESLRYKNAIDLYEKLGDYEDCREILKRLKILKKVIGAAKEDDEPSVWRAQAACQQCGQQAEYRMDFYTDGRFTLEAECAGQHETQQMTGYFQIDGGKIFYKQDKKVKTEWKQISRIKDMKASEEDWAPGDTAMTITNPFDEKTDLVLYGYVTSSDTITVG